MKDTTNATADKATGAGSAVRDEGVDLNGGGEGLTSLFWAAQYKVPVLPVAVPVIH